MKLCWKFATGRTYFLGAAVALALIVVSAHAQRPSFNGAEGFGGTFTGTAPAGGWFSNADVYHVTTTADTINPSTGKPAVGTLRGAFYDYTNPNSPKQQASNRIVVFDVGGVFQLTQGSLDIKTVNNIYVAGQTAPSPVTVYGNTTQITKSSNTMTSNVILRYLTFRKGTGDGEDAITFSGGNGSGSVATNMILDHVSASWAEDEDLSVANNNTNVTVQYSIIADALTSNHAYGSLIRPQVDASVSFHHNLYANNVSRQARFGTYNAAKLTADFRNNVIYNWRDRASYTGGSSEAQQEFTDVNYVGNYLVAGAGTIGSPSTAYSVDKNVDTRVYQSGNFVDSDKALNPEGVPNGSDRGWAAFVVSTPVTDQTMTQMATPFGVASVTTQTAPSAFDQVLQYVGNNWWSREAIDARIINNVKTNTGPADGIGAAAPNATELSNLLATPTTTRSAGWDSDGDGMPDAWEAAHGLNPNSNADFKLDLDNDGYVNLQEYLDEVGAFRAPTPLSFNGATNNRYALITNWKTGDFVSGDSVVHPGSNWQPTRFDEARINNGTVVVDAVGQHAGLLKVGAAAGQSATLNITGGWLDVASQLLVGADAAATAIVKLSGGVLRASTISIGAGGTFSFTGGKLHAETINFSLINDGGTLAPGDSIGATHANMPPQRIGQTHVIGDLALASGALEIELAAASGAGAADMLVVNGDVTLGGSLNVLTHGGFTPTLGNNWQIIVADNILGQFTSITSGYSVQKQGGTLRLYFGPAPLSGDFNSDQRVDMTDYIVWRSGLGTAYTLDDYNVWRANFGATAGATAHSNQTAVPEPHALLFVGVVAAGGWENRRRLRNR